MAEPTQHKGGDDGLVEIDRPPVFEPGTKVRARVPVRDDGTTAGARIGDVLVEAGDVGYVRSVGAFLQRHWIYDVDFIRTLRVVGMRAHELESAESDPPPPQEDA
ncbi:nitrogen fixation protein NifZ [uncultured Rhodospira sp.]|uniref:nitrogen fixation protein NifZ n=1 Tax=uncultured Rhodospira sp. TaxID=1936189 RepID=UPI00262B4449|nr:nitrogen fixation protein NifZ [uncultured Rhodospira sp.]